VAIARKKHAAGVFFPLDSRRPAGADAASARGVSGVAAATPRTRLRCGRVSRRPCFGARSSARGRENGAARSAGRRRGGAPAAPRVQFSLALPARVGKLTKEFASIGGENLTGVEEE